MNYFEQLVLSRQHADFVMKCGKNIKCSLNLHLRKTVLKKTQRCWLSNVKYIEMFVTAQMDSLEKTDA